jgi:hypothetical protein
MHESTETMTELVPDVWTAQAPIGIVGMPLTTTMTVVRLPDGSLLVHAPIEPTPPRRAAVQALGEVRHVYAPSCFHHLFAGGWAEAFPQARVHGPVGLAKKRKDLRIDRVHGDPDPAFEAVFDEVPIRGFRLGETVLLHRPSRTLVVADLVHNIGRPPNLWTKVYAGSMGFYGRIAISRMLRWVAFDDRRAARQSLDDILALPFDRIVVGHGAPILDDAAAQLREAYAWLAPAS